MVTEAYRQAKLNAETAFKKLAEVFGKQTLLWESVKGRAVPNVGAWTLDYDPGTGTYLIREIVDKTGRDKTPFGIYRLPADQFIVAVDMIIRAINVHEYLYPTLPGVRHELPPGEVYGAHFPQVTIEGTTYVRDDVKNEFRVVGDPQKRISFRDYEKRYFDDYRQLRIYFSGNVATMQSSHSGGYKTTSQANALQAIDFWVFTGVLKPGAGPEAEREIPGRGTGNWLDIVKAKGKINIADNHNQNLQTDDIPKAVRAIRSWVVGGILK